MIKQDCIKVKYFALLWVLILGLLAPVHAQLPGLHIKKAQGKIMVDGEMNEADWQSSEIADKFRQFFPFDSSAAKCVTEVRMTYDDHFIYVFARMSRSLCGGISGVSLLMLLSFSLIRTKTKPTRSSSG
jgi:hypothetical protein